MPGWLLINQKEKGCRFLEYPDRCFWFADAAAFTGHHENTYRDLWIVDADNRPAACSIGLVVKKQNSFGWIMVIAGVLSAVAAVMMVFNIGTGAVGISTLLGLQVLLTGIALVLLSFTKKIVAGRIKDKIESLRSGL